MTPLILLAAVAATPQNHGGHGALLPPGWRVGPSTKDEGAVAAFVGPRGQEIAFPSHGADGANGQRATRLRKSEPAALFGRFVLAGRPVEVALARDGRLAISYPRVAGTHRSFAPFDYWTRVGSAEDAAEALLIALTRIEAWRGPGYGDEQAGDAPKPAAPPNSSGRGRFPGDVQFPPDYAYLPSLVDEPAGGRFEAKGLPTVEYRPDFSKPGTGSPADPDRLAKWTVSRTILGRSIKVAEGERGLAAWQTGPGGIPFYGSFPIFAAGEASPRAAVVTVLACLSFRPSEG